MKKCSLLFILILLSVFVFSSCSTQKMARFYVENKTKSRITNFEIYWDTDDGRETLVIDSISGKSTSAYYAAFIKSVDVDFGEECSTRFYLSYTKDGVEYNVNNSTTKVEDDLGNVFDPEAVFVSDELYCIEIHTDEYSIKLKK